MPGNLEHSTQTIEIFTVKTMVKDFSEIFCYEKKLIWRQKSLLFFEIYHFFTEYLCNVLKYYCVIVF